MNNRRGILILLVIFFVLGVLVALQPRFDRLLNPAPTPAPERTSGFQLVFEEADFNVTDIQAIRLQSPVTDESLTLARSADGTWTATNLEGTFNQEAAANIATTIFILPYIYTLPVPEGETLEAFGFANGGDFQVLVLLRDGTEHTIAIGNPLPSSPEFYACVDDFCTSEPPTLHIVQRSPIDYLVGLMQAPPLDQ
ncbi:MAG: hypothetical protein SF029_25275 [bacterium]|nr:hypothetical protein [bacterium]